jgi:hypothetical protein
LDKIKLLNLLKHRGEEHDSKNSSGFTIAELGAGLGVFAVAASLMMPMAISSATATMTAEGDTNVTVDNDNGRKPVTTPPVDAVEVTVLDATGNEVKTVTVDDPNATSTVISGLDPDETYTFEVAKINAAGKSAKATAKLDYQKTGTEEYEVDVTENYTERKSATVSATPEQVNDTSRPQYKTVDDKSKPIYKQVQENYTDYETRTRKVRESYRVRVATPQYRNTNHRHYRYVWSTRTVYSNHRHSYNHRHRYYSSYNHRHRYCYNHTHRWRWYRWNHRHCGSWNHRHGGYRTSYHTHYSNHTHRDHVRYRMRQSYNHMHRIHWTTTYSYVTRYRYVPEEYTVPVTKTRTKTVLDGYKKKQVFTGYAKKTQYRLCYQPRGRNGVKLGQRCEIKSSPATKTLTWTVDKQRTVKEKRSKDVFGHVKQTSVKAQPGYVIFKADNLTNGRIIRSGEVAAVGAGVSNISEGSNAKFLRWSGKTFTFNGEKYIKVHRFAVR